MDRTDNKGQPSPASDASLLRLAMAGEESAFLLLYQKLKDGIFRYAFYMTNSKSAAEEATQEVFIALLEEGHKYRVELGEVGAFAFGIRSLFWKASSSESVISAARRR